MTDFDSLAEQHQTADGNPLIDYLPIGLPIYLLQLESLVAEKRNLMPVEEFILKAVRTGARTADEVIGVLGIGREYGRKLINSLGDDEYVSQNESISLRPKGAAALSEVGERRIYEKVVPFAWDPLLQRAVLGKLSLRKAQALRLERVVRVLPPSTRLPPLTHFPLEQLPGAHLHDTEQVIRFLSVQRRTLLYQPAVLLLYGRGKGNDPLARVAVDGVVSEPTSHAFARNELLPRMGVDSLFSRRMGATAVDSRIKPLGLLPGNESLLDLLRVKSTLQLGIESLGRRSTDDAAAKLETKKAELASVQEKLQQIPVRSLMPFEMPQLVDLALQKARHDVLITTTLPVDARLTPLRLLLLDQALKRRVKVRMLISDRPTNEEFAKEEGPIQLLHKLNEMMMRHPHLEVSFLKETDRVVFEVKMDDTMLAVANEPPLGMRAREPLARLFSGYQLSGGKSVKAYESNHLTPQAVDVVGRIKLPASNERKRPAARHG